ncbi:MAG: CoA transferase [Bacteroidetes bacterium]|nr:CoA transferase [Bacteroidota bacterium]
MSTKQNQLFKGLKVIELSSVLAGPAVGMFFAELGASVLKVENKSTEGDVTRNWKLPVEDPTDAKSAYYNSINWGKQVLFLDFKQSFELETLKKLLLQADILITNFKTGSASQFGLDRDGVKALNPKIIHTNLTAYGEDELKPGFDVLLQAETGFLHMNGHPGGKPAKMPVALIDLLAAHQMKEAILIALLERYKTGHGSYITVNLFDSAIASLANQASNYLNTGFIPNKMGSAHPNISPYGEICTTSDQLEIILAVGTEKQFRDLCGAIELSDLPSDERFMNNAARVANRQALSEILCEKIGTLESVSLLKTLIKLKVPAGKVRDMKEVFDQGAAKKMILEYKDRAKCVKTISFKIHTFKS